MKALRGILTAAVMAATLVFVPAHASGYVNQADIDAIDTATMAYTSFIDETNKASATLESVTAKANEAAQAFDKLTQYTFSTDLGSAYVTEATTLKNEAGALRDKIREFSAVAATGNKEKLDTYFTELKNEAIKFDNQIDKVNNAVDDSNKSVGGGYLWLVIGTALISAGAFVWAFLLGKKTVQSKPQLEKPRRVIAYASLAPLAGALITYLYIHT